MEFYATSTDSNSSTVVDEPQLQNSDVSADAADRNLSKSKLRQLRMKTLFKKKQLYPNSHPQKLALDRAVVQMIVKDFQPLCLVDDLGLRNLVHVLDPKYDLPSRKTLSSCLLPNLHSYIHLQNLMLYKSFSYASL